MGDVHRFSSRSLFVVSCLFAVAQMLMCFGCRSAGAQQLSTLDERAQKSQVDQIKAVLDFQVDAWNQGNLEKFMDTYWKSDKLTFSGGGTVTRGWQATLDRYKKSYTPERMGKLHFSDLEITILETKSALVLGNWHLRQTDGTSSDGNFTLVLAQIEGGWKIIHDHSATLKKE